MFKFKNSLNLKYYKLEKCAKIENVQILNLLKTDPQNQKPERKPSKTFKNRKKKEATEPSVAR
jgi:hypothetical protein